jgi:hypothetical protein
MRALCAISVLMLSWSGALAQGANEQTIIDLAYDETDMRVRPDPAPGGVRHVIHLVLSNGNEVTETKSDTAADGKAEHSSFQNKLGGENGRVVWHVAGHNSLIRFQDWPQSTLTMKVTLLPNKSCTLEVTPKLKPGFTEYEIYSIHKGSMAYYSKWETSNPTCAIR